MTQAYVYQEEGKLMYVRASTMFLATSFVLVEIGHNPDNHP